MAVKKELTEEQKAVKAAALAKAREAKKAMKAEADAEKAAVKEAKQNTETAKVDTRDAEIEALKEQLAEQQKQFEAQMEQMKQMQTLMMQASAQPQVIKVAADEKQVHFLWMAEVADDNVVMFGEGGMYGRIVGKVGTFYVPKNDLSRIMTSMNRLFLEKRWLIVLSGLEPEERVSLGVDYKEGEILDRQAFERLLEIGDDILDIFPELCDGHKEMVAQRFYEAWLNRSPYITRERVLALGRMSNLEAFKRILDGINEEDANSLNQ